MAKNVIKKVMVLGLGKVGTLVATLLDNMGFEVLGVDSHPQPKHLFKVSKIDLAKTDALRKQLKSFDAVVSCLPFFLNKNIAKLAHETKTHYFDLTEDVPTTKEIIKLSKTASTVMAPQCGLAPGFIGIVGAELATKFDSLRSIELRVGALPEDPKGMLGYAFNWSAEGVVNEYLNDCEVILNGEHKWVPALSGHETLFIKGIPLEAFYTSGGLGTMCETYAGKVETLNYKTIRYPGHCDLMKFFFHELHMQDRRKEAGEILVNAKPPVNEDVVFVYAAVEGIQNKAMKREEFVRAYKPKMISKKMYKAISWTTASSLCAVIEMVSTGKLPQKGFIKQEEIPLDTFLKTKTGKYFI